MTRGDLTFGRYPDSWMCGRRAKGKSHLCPIVDLMAANKAGERSVTDFKEMCHSRHIQNLVPKFDLASPSRWEVGLEQSGFH